MEYILVVFQDGQGAYQELSAGRVVRYTDMDGKTLFKDPPPGMGSKVLDAKPPQPDWALPDVPAESAVFTAPDMRITKLALRNRLTFEEKVALEKARTASEEVRAWMRDFDTALDVDLSHPQLITGIRALESFGVLPKGRADEILSAPPQAQEVSNV